MLVGLRARWLVTAPLVSALRARRSWAMPARRMSWRNCLARRSRASSVGVVVVSWGLWVGVRWWKRGCILEPAKISMMVSQSHIVASLVRVAGVLVREGVVGEQKDDGSGSSLVAGDVKMASHLASVK